MRKLLVGLVAGLAVATAAAQEWQQAEAHLKWSMPLSELPSMGGIAADPLAYYSNIDNFTGFGDVPGGAALVGADRITRLLADKVTPAGPSGNGLVTEITFSVANFNQTPATTSARPRLRFWDDNGVGGGPGTLLGGFTFNPISFSALSANLFFFNPVAFGPLAMVDGGSFWVGITFDNNGTSGVTLAQLNNLGVLISDPPSVGSSADGDWLSTAAGSNFVSNPAGTLRNSPFGGNPPANHMYEFIPEPTTLALVALGGLLAARRRR